MKSLQTSHSAAKVGVRLSELLPGQRRLVLLMAELEFGDIKGLHVRAGQPWFESPPSVTRELKFSERSPSPAEPPGIDFVLRRQVLELLRALESLRDGVVDCVEVRHGLPHRLFLTGPHLEGRAP